MLISSFSTVSLISPYHFPWDPPRTPLVLEPSQVCIAGAAPLAGCSPWLSGLRRPARRGRHTATTTVVATTHPN